MDGYTYKNVENEKNRAKYEVEVEYARYQELEDKFFKSEALKVKLPGFREGKAPLDLIKAEIADKVFNKAINTLLPAIAGEIIEKEDLRLLSYPEYSLESLDPEKGIKFTFVSYTHPKIEVDKIKKIDIKLKKNEVKEEDIDPVVKNLIKDIKGEPEEVEAKKDETPSTEVDDAEIVGEEDKKSEKKEVAPLNKEESVKLEMTEDQVKSLNLDGVTNYEQLRVKIKEILQNARNVEMEEHFLVHAIEELLKVNDFMIPEDMVIREIERKELEYRERLKRIKLDEESYLKTLGTSFEDLKKGWRTEVEELIKSDLLLIDLALDQKKTPTDDEVDASIKSIKDPEAKRTYSDEEGKNYYRTLMIRENGKRTLLSLVNKIEE